MGDRKNLFSKSLFNTGFSVGSLVLVLIILIFANLIFANINLRWDATADKLYSLSENTREIINDSETDIVIKFFYTQNDRNMPVHFKNYAKRVLDLLREYELSGKGKITLETFNPRPDSEEEDWANTYGIRGIQLPSGEIIYLGLVAMAADQEETIPFLDPGREENLEYDITRIIAKIQSPEKRKIGIISSLPVFGSAPRQMQFQPQPPVPWLFITELEKTYDVAEIKPDAEKIGSDIDLLLLLHPKDVSENMLYQIDRFVLSGKNCIVFADPMAVSDQTGNNSSLETLEKLFDAWGVKTYPGKAVVDFSYSTRLLGADGRPQDNPSWLSFDDRAFNRDDPVTSKLESVLLPVCGAFSAKEGSDITLTPLLTTTTDAGLYDAMRLRFGGADIRKDFASDAAGYNPAVKIRGVFNSAFPEGKPAENGDENSDKDKISSENTDSAEGHLEKGKKKSTVIIIGDADLLFDNYYVEKQNFLGFNMARVFNDNLNFLLNSAEMLTGNPKLIDIRSSGVFNRPFIKVRELEQKAHGKWMEKEQALVLKAEETNARIMALEQQKNESQQLIINDEQENEIKKFHEIKRDVNRQLKDVRRNLRAEIETLGGIIKFINIFLMPLFVVAAGISFALYRRKKATESEN